MADLDSAAGTTVDRDYNEPIYLNVTLRDIDNEELFPLRHFPIGHPWSFKIGRGSQGELNLQPQDHNSWFGSRVMSREHAVVRIDPDTRDIEIEDTDSMHGTYLHGARLRVGEPVAVSQGDVIVFGADIIRGDVTYKALKVRATFDWSDGHVLQRADNLPSMLDNTSSEQVEADRHRNTFTFDYIENIVDDDDEDDDVEIVAARTHSRTPVASEQRRTFSVPDSDGSDGESEEEDEDEDDDDAHSSPSSLAEDDAGELAPIDSSQTIQTESIRTSSLRPMQVQHSTHNTRVIVIDDEEAETEERNKIARMDKLLQNAQEEFDKAQQEHNRSGMEDFEADSDMNVLVSDSGLSGPTASLLQPIELCATMSYDNDNLDPSTSNAEPKVSQITSVWPIAPGFEYGNPSARGYNLPFPSVPEAFARSQSEHVSPEGFLSNINNAHPSEAHSHQGVISNETKSPKQFSKVSISDIIHEQNDTTTTSKLKRKADDVIDSDDLVVSAELPNPFTRRKTDIEVSRALIRKQRRKRARREAEAERIETNTKAAAIVTTAFVSAVIGAVGALFGIAALPSDYFT